MDRPLRRVPVQGRSVARVARMLDACAELVEEVGCDGLTTTMLAERARVAIGSVYQFFPDKQAVVRALTVRNLEAYLCRLEGRLDGVTVERWWDAVEAAVDEYIAMHRSVPGFRTLRFGDIGDRSLIDDDRDNGTLIADHLIALVTRPAGEGPAGSGDDQAGPVLQDCPAQASTVSASTVSASTVQASTVHASMVHASAVHRLSEGVVAGPRRPVDETSGWSVGPAEIGVDEGDGGSWPVVGSEVRFALTVAIEISDALVKMAFRRNPDGDPVVLAECRDLAREYLERRVPVPG